MTTDESRTQWITLLLVEPMVMMIVSANLVSGMRFHHWDLLSLLEEIIVDNVLLTDENFTLIFYSV